MFGEWLNDKIASTSPLPLSLVSPPMSKGLSEVSFLPCRKLKAWPASSLEATSFLYPLGNL